MGSLNFRREETENESQKRLARTMLGSPVPIRYRYRYFTDRSRSD